MIDVQHLIDVHQLDIKTKRLGKIISQKRVARTFTVVEGLSPSNAAWSVHNNTLINLKRAIVERLFLVKDPLQAGQFKKPPQPIPGIFSSLDGYMRELVSIIGERSPRTPREWLKGVPHHLLPRYKRAVADYEIGGWDDRYFMVCSFVKNSKVLVLDQVSDKFIPYADKFDEDDPPRGIHPRHEIFIVEMGTMIQPIESPDGGNPTIYQAITVMWSRHTTSTPLEEGGFVCVKGKTPAQVGARLWDAWCMYIDPLYIIIDSSRFSQHCSAEALEFVHRLFKTIYFGQAGSEAREAFLEACLYVTGSAVVPDMDGMCWRITFQLLGRLMDGTPETSLVGNFVTNALVHEAMVVRLGVNDIQPIDNGDDFGFIMDKSHVPDMKHVVATFLEFGFELKVENGLGRSVFEHIEFCQCSPVHVEGGVTMCPNPDRLQKDVIMQCSLADAEERLFAIGMGGLAFSAGLPIMQSFYKCMVRLSGIKGKFQKKMLSHIYSYSYNMYEWLKDHDVNALSSHSVDVASISRVSYYRAYGITPHVQRELESMYDRAEYGEPIPYYVQPAQQV